MTRDQRQLAINPSKAEHAFVDLIDPDLEYSRRHTIYLRLGGAHRVTPDLVFPAAGVAVFYDGCYWHECPDHAHEIWDGKVATKDAAVTSELVTLGWQVFRVWEHEPLMQAAHRVNAAVRSRLDEQRLERIARIGRPEGPSLVWQRRDDGAWNQVVVRVRPDQLHELRGPIDDGVTLSFWFAVGVTTVEDWARNGEKADWEAVDPATLRLTVPRPRRPRRRTPPHAEVVTVEF